MGRVNLDAVADALGEAVKTTGLRIPPWGVEKIVPPAAVITVPAEIAYDQTKGRGFDRFRDMQVLVLLARGEQHATREALSAYTDGAGPKSVKAAIEGHDYADVCDTVKVVTATFEVIRFAEIPYEGVIFSLDITGRGATP